MKTQKELTQLLSRKVEDIKLGQHVELASYPELWKKMEVIVFEINKQLRKDKALDLSTSLTKTYDQILNIAEELQKRKIW